MVFGIIKSSLPFNKFVLIKEWLNKNDSFRKNYLAQEIYMHEI